MGSALRTKGWASRDPTALANLAAPHLVRTVHRAHRAAGARVVTTNTFSALLVNDSLCLETVRAGVRLAREAAGREGRVAGTVAAFGLAVDDPQLEDVVKVLVDEGVDVLVFETCNSLRDAEQAMRLRQRLADQLPAVVCASTTDGGPADRTRVRQVLSFVQTAGDPQVESGLNCCRGPHDTLRMALAGDVVPRWLKPSTGLPSDRADDNVMAAFARTADLHRVRFIGGCCGTSAQALGAMAAALEGNARTA